MTTVAPLQVWIDHLTDDRTGPDDRDLDHQIVKTLGLQARQRRHLCAALDLENPDSVGAPQHRVDLGIVGRQMREVDLDIFMRANHRDRLLQHGEHPQPEQIDLDDAEVGAILLVPLHDHAARHAGGFERNDLVERTRRDHHPAAMLPEMTRHALDAPHQVDHHRDARRGDIDATTAQQCDDIVMVIAKFVGLIEARELVDLLGRKAEHLADLAHGAARAIGDDIRGHRGAAFAVAPIDVLDDLLALVAAGQVEIDIGPFAALLGKEALEQQFHPDRVDGGDSERVADRAVGRRAASLRHDSILAAELHDVPYDQEVAGELAASR